MSPLATEKVLKSSIQCQVKRCQVLMNLQHVGPTHANSVRDSWHLLKTYVSGVPALIHQVAVHAMERIRFSGLHPTTGGSLKTNVEKSSSSSMLALYLSDNPKNYFYQT